MAEIPYGETRVYGELAASVGSAPRAVGRACGRNPIPIVIPCHRVLAKAGLGGYSGSAGSRPSGICSRSKAPRLNNRNHRRMGRANAKPMP